MNILDNDIVISGTPEIIKNKPKRQPRVSRTNSTSNLFGFDNPRLFTSEIKSANLKVDGGR